MHATGNIRSHGRRPLQYQPQDPASHCHAMSKRRHQHSKRAQPKPVLPWECCCRVFWLQLHVMQDLVAAGQRDEQPSRSPLPASHCHAMSKRRHQHSKRAQPKPVLPWECCCRVFWLQLHVMQDLVAAGQRDEQPSRSPLPSPAPSTLNSTCASRTIATLWFGHTSIFIGTGRISLRVSNDRKRARAAAATSTVVAAAILPIPERIHPPSKAIHAWRPLPYPWVDPPAITPIAGIITAINTCVRQITNGSNRNSLISNSRIISWSKSWTKQQSTSCNVCLVHYQQLTSKIVFVIVITIVIIDNIIRILFLLILLVVMGLCFYFMLPLMW